MILGNSRCKVTPTPSLPLWAMVVGDWYRRSSVHSLALTALKMPLCAPRSGSLSLLIEPTEPRNLLILKIASVGAEIITLLADRQKIVGLYSEDLGCCLSHTITSASVFWWWWWRTILVPPFTGDMSDILNKYSYWMTFSWVLLLACSVLACVDKASTMSTETLPFIQVLSKLKQLDSEDIFPKWFSQFCGPECRNVFRKLCNESSQF